MAKRTSLTEAESELLSKLSREWLLRIYKPQEHYATNKQVTDKVASFFGMNATLMTSKMMNKSISKIQPPLYGKVNSLVKSIGDLETPDIHAGVVSIVLDQILTRMQRPMRTLHDALSRLNDDFPKSEIAWPLFMAQVVCEYDFLDQTGLAEITDELRELRELTKLGIYAYLVNSESELSVLRLPKSIETNDELMLHSITGPAVVWPNVKNGYYLRGVAFNNNTAIWEKIAKQELDVGGLLSIGDIEQRRAAIETYGPERIFELGKAKLISGPTARGNQLYKFDDQQLNRTKVLRYSNPSDGREFFKFVPDRFVDADEAQAWSHHLTKEEYINECIIEA